MFVSKDKPIVRSMPIHQAQKWLREDGASQNALVKVFVNQQSLLKVIVHAKSDLLNEVGGWLVGSWCKDEALQEEFIMVEAIIPAKDIRQGSTFVTFTHDSQIEMLNVLEERYPKKKVVGWYHTHPRMGLFLSEYDLWLHRQFFSQPWQVALVVDPHPCVGAFFIRDENNELDAHRYHGFYEVLQEGMEAKGLWKNLIKEEKLVIEDVKNE